MKIAPLKVSDPWFGRITNDTTLHADSLNGVPVETTVEMELVELLHAGPEGNYRPYLHLRGELTTARPVVELPYGVEELVMSRGAGLPVDAFYDFNREQLVHLVEKGYFSEAFAVPQEMSGIPWTIPGKADFMVVAPAFSDEPPLVFMSMHDQNEMELTEANSGYELSAYFADVTAEAEAEAQVREGEPVAVHTGPVMDIFSDHTFDERRPVEGVARVEITQERATVPDGVFSRLVAEIQSRHAAPQVETEPVEEVETRVTAADVYESLIAPGVEHVLSDTFVADEQVPADELQPEEDLPVDAEAGADAAPEDLEAAPEGYLDLAGDAEVEIDHVASVKARVARAQAELAGSHYALDDDSQPEI